MSIFPTMHELLKPKKQGTAEIVHYEVSDFEAGMAAIRREWVTPGKYAVLRVRGETVMSDTGMERRSNSEVVWRSHGRVLIAGLGIGMILHPIIQKPEVTSVTVIEINHDVIALVARSVKHEKLTIIEANINEWRPTKGEKFNTIYFDIWPDKCADYLEEMSKLHQRFKSYKDRSDPKCWMESWSRQELKARQRSYRQHAIW